ncbi:hypothetical protein LLB_2005 [Legionella longbeachae D-4968]|nr:hypothetical protein LLB_2005 [Legionella longbeachae D-4968]
MILPIILHGVNPILLALCTRSNLLFFFITLIKQLPKEILG